MATRKVFYSVWKPSHLLCQRMNSPQLLINCAGVHNLSFTGLVIKHKLKIALGIGVGVGVTGFVANSQIGALQLGTDIEKEAVVVGNDLMEAFAKDVKKEMEKEMMKLGKSLMHEELSKDGNATQDNANKASENSEDTNKHGKKLFEEITEVTNEVLVEAEEIGVSQLGTDIEKEAVVVGNDLIESFAKDVKNEMEKEMMKLIHEELSKDGNDTQDNANMASENSEDTNKHGKKLVEEITEETNEVLVEAEEIEKVKGTVDVLIEETNELLSDSEIIVNVKDVAKEGVAVLEHFKMLTWKVIKLAHALVTLLLAFKIVFHFNN